MAPRRVALLAATSRPLPPEHEGLPKTAKYGAGEPPCIEGLTSLSSRDVAALRGGCVAAVLAQQ